MPKVSAERLHKIGAALLVGAGASPEEADTVARGCVNANLVGHDSHGVILIPSYVERIKVGHIVPGAPFKIVQESPTTTVIDGHWGFGFVVNERAMQLTIEKAKTTNVAAATVFPPEPCRTARRLSADGRAGRHDRDCHRGFRPLAQGGGTVRRTRGAARHQPDRDRGAVGSAGPAVPRHGDVGGRGRQAHARAGARRENPARLDRRQATASTRPTRRASVLAARCCRSAAPRATRAAGLR